MQVLSHSTCYAEAQVWCEDCTLCSVSKLTGCHIWQSIISQPVTEPCCLKGCVQQFVEQWEASNVYVFSVIRLLLHAASAKERGPVSQAGNKLLMANALKAHTCLWPLCCLPLMAISPFMRRSMGILLAAAVAGQIQVSVVGSHCQQSKPCDIAVIYNSSNCLERWRRFMA